MSYNTLATGLVANNQGIGRRAAVSCTRRRTTRCSQCADTFSGDRGAGEAVAKGAKLDAVGMISGIIRHGVAEESPNLQQSEGFSFSEGGRGGAGGEMAESIGEFVHDAEPGGGIAQQGVLHRLNRV